MKVCSIKFQQLIQIVIYSGTTKESYAETPVRLYMQQPKDQIFNSHFFLILFRVNKLSDVWITKCYTGCILQRRYTLIFQSKAVVVITIKYKPCHGRWGFDGPQFPPYAMKKKGRVKRNQLLMFIKEIYKMVEKVYHVLKKREKKFRSGQNPRTRNCQT